MAEVTAPPILPEEFDAPEGYVEDRPADPTPKAKVVAGGLAGAATTIILFLLNSVGVDIPGEVGAAITTVVGFVVSYITSEH